MDKKEKIRKVFKAYELKLKIGENEYNAYEGEQFDEIYGHLIKLLNLHGVIKAERAVCDCLEPEPYGRYTVQRNQCSRCNKRIAN